MTRLELIDYIKRSLGEPLIKVNVSNEQINDRIDDALKYYHEYHYDSTYRKYFSIELTQDIVNTGSIDLPPNAIRCIKIYNTSISITNNFTNFAILSDIIKNNSITDGVTGWLSLQTRLADLDAVFKHFFHIEHIGNKIQINANLGLLAVGNLLGVECLCKIDDEYAFDDIWFRQYVTALVQIQWGTNLSKFRDASLAGGMKFNAKEILEEGKENKKICIDEMERKNSNVLMGGIF